MGGKRTLRVLPEGPAGPEGDAYEVQTERSKGGYRVSADSPAFVADVERAERGAWSVLTEAGSFEAQVSSDDGVVHVLVEGEHFWFEGRHAAMSRSGGKTGAARADVKAPMPGKVVKLLVVAGDVVAAGQGVLLFEAMKMQNEIKSPLDGTVGEVFVAEGQAVDARDPMFVVLPN